MMHFGKHRYYSASNFRFSALSFRLYLFLLFASFFLQSTASFSVATIIPLDEQPNDAKTLTQWVSDNLEIVKDSALVYDNAHRALRLSIEADDELLKGKSLRNLGTWHERAKTIDSSLFYYNKAITTFKEANEQKELAFTYLELSEAYTQRTKYTEAETNAFVGLEILEELKDNHGIALSYISLSNLFYYSDNWEKGVEYSQKAIDILKALDQPKDLAKAYNFLAGNLLFANELEEGLENSNTALKILEEAKIGGIDILRTRNTRANILKYLKRYDEALADYEANLETSKQYGDEGYQIASIGNIGHVYRLKEEYETAIPYFNEAIEKIKATGNTKNLWENYLHLSISHESLGNYKEALEYDILYVREREAYLGSIIDRLESELAIKYETDKKNETIASQEEKISQQKRIQTLYIGIAVLLGILLFGMYFSLKNIRKKRHQLAAANTELEEKRKSVEESNRSLEASISELKATQAQLIQAEKMASLGELTAGIAHEIQNPLNFVNNFSEVSKELIEEMQEEMKNGDTDEVNALAKDITDNLDKILHHGKRADGIVKGMLQHSRKSTGEKVLTDINEMTDEYLRLAYHGLRAKDKSFNASLVTEFDKKLEPINVVAQDIGRVVLNLLTNAFHAVHERAGKEENFRPEIQLSTSKLNGEVHIKISDNGGGIPEKIKEKIFQPFFTTKPTGQGTGLGLSLSYDIVKAHGGMLSLDSEEGVGATFLITLPVS